MNDNKNTSDTVSRRSFLRMAGTTGALIGSGSLGCNLFKSEKKPEPDPKIIDEDPIGKVAEGNFPGTIDGKINYRTAKAVPTICFGCTTHCGVIGWIQNDRVRRISGNPLDPNTNGKLCAKANGMISYTYYPERLLYPLKRVGKRGEGKWKRISWDAAIAELASKLKPLRDNNTPERFVFHYGRDKTKGVTKRFTHAFGTPHRLNRRSICSSNRRAPLMSFYGREFEWESQDIEKTKYIVNFGANPCEAYQGGMFILQRLQHARVDKGAKMVTFEVRPSATASISDQYFPIMPGTDGAVAMAMCHVIYKNKLYNKDFWDRWVNMPLEEIWPALEAFTPEFAEKESGIPAKDIERIAKEFAAAAPACFTMSNRGSAKHYNGFQADRAIRLMDVLVGNVGKPGGFCLSSLRGWAGRYGQDGLPKISQPGPKPKGPKAWLPGTREFNELPKDVQERVKGFPEKWQKKYFGELATPSEYPLSWHWYQMRVGQLVYPYIKEGRAKVDVYMSYSLGAAYGYPEANVARDVLKDEKLIPYHVAIDIGIGEQAALADLILPDATSLERWDAHSTNSYGLVPYTGIRQPLTKPIGEAKAIQYILRDIARAVGGGMEQYFDFEDVEDFYKEWYKDVPLEWEELKRRGIWYDKDRPQDYELYERKIARSDLTGSTFNTKTGVISKVKKGKKVAVGIKMADKQFVQGFPTPSRKIEVRDDIFAIAAKCVGIPVSNPLASELPTYFKVPGHEKLKDDQFIFTTFKWNVHTQGRSGHWKYSAEIVHSNPLWMHPDTGKQLGLTDGDEVEVTVYRPEGYTYKAKDANPVNAFRNRVKFIKGMHKRVVASSHHVGHWDHGAVGGDKPGQEMAGSEGFDKRLNDSDITEKMWWSKSKGGVGHGVHINDALPINPAPLVGGQNWYDNICQVKKV
ncbi:MAG: molybdopterin-dependent oxidoreductase [Planctomycetota bacterium]|nr:molybdopterin-dependent oxidoreductase [Planctomycetota bacterium]